MEHFSASEADANSSYHNDTAYWKKHMIVKPEMTSVQINY